MKTKLSLPNLSKRLLCLTGILAISVGMSIQVHAQNFPTKPITLVVPFSAGGPTDAVARMLAGPMSQTLGQTVIVENTAGAGGTIGSNRVAKANPDGYTILLHHMGMATAPSLYNKLPFNPLKDFEYIGQVVDVPMTLIARKNFPANNYQELITYLKANKDKIMLANAGPGSVAQLCGLLFMSKTGIQLTTVPYKGTGPAMTDILGGQVDLLCDQTSNTVANIKANTVKAFGSTTLKRLSTLPNLPTLHEQGLKGFEVVVWHGLYAPKDTPKPTLEKINVAMKAALNDPTVKSRLADLSIEIPSSDKLTPSGLQKQLESEIKKWAPIIKAAGQLAE